MIFLLGLSGVCFTSAAETDCIDGIETAVSYLTFNGSAELSYYVNMCSNDLVVISLWAAAKVYCTPQEILAGYDEYNPICQEYGSVALTPYAEVEPKLTDDYLKSLPVAEFSDVQDFTLFDTPVMISSDLYKAARDTSVSSLRSPVGDLDADKGQVDFSYEYVLHQRYGYVDCLLTQFPSLKLLRSCVKDGHANISFLQLGLLRVLGRNTADRCDQPSRHTFLSVSPPEGYW